MILRTQTGRPYQSFSSDAASWSPPVPTRFYASNSPAHVVRLRDGRIVLLWNSAQSAPAIDGSEPYTCRDVLHAALSADDGKTWHGFREVYRAPRRNVSPPKEGTSCGTAYPDAVVTTYNSTVLQQNGPLVLRNVTNGGQIINNAPMTWDGGTTWSQGDLNYDGRVTADDYMLFMLGQSCGGAANIATLPVPGPAAAMVLSGTALGLLSCGRRHRRRHRHRH